MEKKTVIDRRAVGLEKVMKKDFIPFLGGRPKREAIIGLDEIMNLLITLNTTGSVEEFLKVL